MQALFHTLVRDIDVPRLDTVFRSSMMQQSHGEQQRGIEIALYFVNRTDMHRTCRRRLEAYVRSC